MHTKNEFRRVIILKKKWYRNGEIVGREMGMRKGMSENG
jgi:hypothetical protein